MNLRKITYLLSFSVLLLGSCVTKQLGYFEVNPYAQVSTNKIDQPLYVRLSDRIGDQFEVKEQGMTLQVKEFHKSLYYAFNRSFKDLFMDVKPIADNNTGFILEVQRMEPKWEIKPHKKDYSSTSTQPENDIWCVVEYASTIYRSDLLVSQSTGTVKVKLGDKNIYSMDALFKETIKQACSKMAQDHFNKK
jgi:hypothetical protein